MKDSSHVPDLYVSLEKGFIISFICSLDMGNADAGLGKRRLPLHTLTDLFERRNHYTYLAEYMISFMYKSMFSVSGNNFSQMNRALETCQIFLLVSKMP